MPGAFAVSVLVVRMPTSTMQGSLDWHVNEREGGREWRSGVSEARQTMLETSGETHQAGRVKSV